MGMELGIGTGFWGWAQGWSWDRDGMAVCDYGGNINSSEIDGNKLRQMKRGRV